MAADSASPSAFSSLVNNTAALQVLAEERLGACGLVEQVATSAQLMSNSAFAAALQSGNVANAINKSE